jgi:hypothetical protein
MHLKIHMLRCILTASLTQHQLFAIREINNEIKKRSREVDVWFQTPHALKVGSKRRHEMEFGAP